MIKWFVLFVLLPGLLVSLSDSTFAQQGTQDGEWRVYGGDKAGTKYSPLKQINKDNFTDLTIAWRWQSLE